MNALKTFLERAKEGGWVDAESHVAMLSAFGLPPTIVENLIFNPEAAQAVWGEGRYDSTDPDSNSYGWKDKQYNILTHIQSGKTPLESLELELN